MTKNNFERFPRELRSLSIDRLNTIDKKINLTLRRLTTKERAYLEWMLGVKKK